VFRVENDAILDTEHTISRPKMWRTIRCGRLEGLVERRTRLAQIAMTFTRALPGGKATAGQASGGTLIRDRISGNVL
jgi:hypothetical protein